MFAEIALAVITAVSPAPAHVAFPPPCAADDGSGAVVCYWDGQAMGNGQGIRYLMYHGHQFNAPGHSRYVQLGDTLYRVAVR